MKLHELTVTLKLGVDHDTAETCLKIVQMYCNENGRNIIGHRQMDGNVLYEFGREGPDEETHDPRKCRFFQSCYGGDRCTGTKELDFCEGEKCKRWKLREEDAHEQSD